MSSASSSTTQTSTPNVPTPTEEPNVPSLDPAVEAAIQNFIGSFLAKSSGPTKKRSADSQDGEEKKSPLHQLGRFYSRQDDPFTRIDDVVNFGIKYEVGDDNDEESSEEAPPLSIKDRRLLRSWRLLCTVIPDFLNQMLALSENRSVRKATCQEIYRGVTAARADDSSSLKYSIPSYLLLNPNDPLIPTIQTKGGHKNDRGFHHPVTASLLCPLKYSDTLEIYNDIKAGRLPVTATLLPRFLFPQDAVYDPADISKGLFAGHLMFRAAKHIFQGPGTSLEEPGAHRGKQGNAALSGIFSMTPYTIAYVAMQVRFALSSTGSWTSKDGAFSYAEFYWHIVELLEDDDEECADIIRLYNHHVFGATKPHDGDGDGVVEVENEYELIKKQRAAKRARLSH